MSDQPPEVVRFFALIAEERAMERRAIKAFVAQTWHR
jgi:hypothetical protein